jgi:hypothetical protein
MARDPHAQWHALYRELLACRHARIVPLVMRVCPGQARYSCPAGRALDVHWPLDDGRTLALYARLGTVHPVARAARDDETIYALADAPDWRVEWRLMRGT